MVAQRFLVPFVGVQIPVSLPPLQTALPAIKLKKVISLLIATIGVPFHMFATHYEIEIIQGEMFLAVWDGAIDVTVDVGLQSIVSFGEGEDFHLAPLM